MLQIRTRVLNEDWEDTFRGWYPGFRPKLENEIKQAAANLAELGRRIRTARTKLHWSQEAFAGVCGLERSYYGGVERGKRNVTFKVLCLSCDGLACDVATITQGLPHLIQAVPVQ